MMIEKNRYLFIIMNTDCSNKNCTHWWSFLDLHERKEIFYSRGEEEVFNFFFFFFKFCFAIK